MGRIFKITEEQYRKALSEGINITADPSSTNGDIKRAYDNARKQIQDSGADMNDATISIPAQNESRIITKKELMEARINKLKRNSDYYTTADFLKKLRSANSK